MTLLDGTCSELVVLSHLRWDWVWQRPQHLISRLGSGIPVHFVEEPVARPDVAEVGWRVSDAGAVRRVHLEVPGDGWVGHAHPLACEQRAALAALLPARRGRVVWLYSALALPYVDALRPDLLVYDVMDDLASFKGADPLQRRRHGEAIARADVVFTGGRSLHRGVRALRRRGVHCFPSGVEGAHYAAAAHARPADRDRPVAGYVGVIDERLDLDLVAGVADRLPGWDVEMVGPVTKIEPATLPRAPNLHWRGPRTYDELPATMAGFDVALMPFAQNDATRSISPTKTLEYLAAGLPVVSTPVPDVVADYADLVAIADDVDGFTWGVREARTRTSDPRWRRAVAAVLHRQGWDTIAEAMAAILAETAARRETGGSDPEDVDDVEIVLPGASPSGRRRAVFAEPDAPAVVRRR